MIAKGIKVRHVKFTMPIPDIEKYDFKKFFALLPSVILPNGKIFILSERSDFLLKIITLAKDFGFIAKQNLHLMTPTFVRQLKSKSMEMLHQADNRNKPLYQLELTYSLRTAFSNKEQRRNWPRN